MTFRGILIGTTIIAAVAGQALAQTVPVDLIISGGPILTMEGPTPRYVEAVAVAGGKIAFAGSRDDAMRLRSSATAMKDLGGKVMLPGFIDPHSHFTDSLSLADRINVSAPPVGPASDPDRIVAELKSGAAKKALKPGELLIGWGYDENLMPEGKVLSRDLLDVAFPDNPVVVVHVSMHGAVLNSKAFEKFGFKDGMPTPDGGIILRKEGSENLQGLVMEAAYLPVLSQLPGPTLENEVEAAKSGQALYAAAGITTAQDGLTYSEQVKQFQRIASKGGWYIDLVAYPFITDLEETWKETPPSAFGKYNGRLKLGGCKITIDGSPQGKTAWFTTPYLTGGPAGQKDWKGEPVMPPAELKAAMQTCYDAGLQVIMHANGDAAVDFLLEAHKEAAGSDVSKDRRTVCVHCQFVRRDQLPLLKQFNIIPSLFSDHTFFFGDTHIANRGKEQASFISPLKSAMAAGTMPTNHTDAFVVPVDQMIVIWTAVNRPTRSGAVLGPDERISAYDALKTITVNAAYQYREEASKGSISAGKLADFVVLSDDPTKVAPMSIKEIKVIETIKEGKTIFSAN